MMEAHLGLRRPSLQYRRFPCVQELSVLVRDQVELLPFCLRKSERGGGVGGRRK